VDLTETATLVTAIVALVAIVAIHFGRAKPPWR
jgi:hypothetical protein